MFSEQFRAPPGYLLHIAGTFWWARHSVDVLGKIQRFLDRPNRVMLVRRQDSDRIPHGYPANRRNGKAGDACLKIYKRIDRNFSSITNCSTVEDRGSRSDERAILDNPAHQMAVWPYETMRSDPRSMQARGPDDSILHHDAVLTYVDRCIFCHDTCAKHNATSVTD